MDKVKEDRLAAAGWRTGDAADFLELSAEEAVFIELKLALADYLRELRTRNAWTQSDVARRLGSSQSRVAKMEASDASVSLDLLVKALLTLGASRGEVGRVIAEAVNVGRKGEHWSAEKVNTGTVA
jgi:DNA-binding XRE family transcriptional regulator